MVYFHMTTSLEKAVQKLGAEICEVLENSKSDNALMIRGATSDGSKISLSSHERACAVPVAIVCDRRDRVGTAYRWNNGELFVRWQ